MRDLPRGQKQVWGKHALPAQEGEGLFAGSAPKHAKTEVRSRSQVREQPRKCSQVQAQSQVKPRSQAQSREEQQVKPRSQAQSWEEQSREQQQVQAQSQEQQRPQASMEPRSQSWEPQSLEQSQVQAQSWELPQPQTKRRRRKILLVVLCAVLVLLAAVGGAIALYTGSLSNTLSYKGDSDQLSDALVEAEKGQPFYVLVIGSDEWEDYGARSDAMVLVRVDLSSPTITMVSVPRDTPYQIDGRTVKLNEVFSEQGEAACIEAVSKMTGVGISHFAKVGFDQLEEVVDSLGGVEVDVPYAFDYQVYTHDRPVVHVDAGKQVLTGEQAVALARMRTAYSYNGITQDAIRQANVRALMIGILKQVLSKPVIELPGQIQSIASMVETDIPLTDLVSWATSIAGAGSVTVYSCTGPTEGDLDTETGLWLTEEAPEQWAKIMTEVDAGRDPSKVMERTETSDGAVNVGSSEIIDLGK